MTWLWVALAGGLGAVTRHVLQVLLGGRSRTPWVTAGINVVGSFLIGLVWAWAASLAVLYGAPAGTNPSPTVPTSTNALLHVVAVGFCGGFTTFSTACVDVAQLLAPSSAGSGQGSAAVGVTAEAHGVRTRRVRAAGLASGTLTLSIGAAAAGWGLGAALF